VYNAFKLYSFHGSDALEASLCSALLVWHFPIVATLLFFVNYFGKKFCIGSISGGSRENPRRLRRTHNAIGYISLL
ncbi:hypothetical protein ACE1AT_21660, partial [Pelatocladus sp. BLCC-F211]|uniref:hypothetical protein n=1 Tax=Pelatocladus sp. BLCC-F211 TaxID=3342752 RepID=UPI0035BA8BBE